MYTYHSRDRAVGPYHMRKSLYLLVKDLLGIVNELFGVSVCRQNNYNILKA